MQDTTPRTMTDQEATEEGLRLFIRKIARLHPDAYADTWSRLPDGAKIALVAGEMRADVIRFGPNPPAWPAVVVLDDEDE